MNTDNQQGDGFSTGALVGVRLFQALGWRVGAGALVFFACPLAGAGGFFLSYVDRCFDFTRPGRAGSYEVCTNYASEHMIGWVALAIGLLFILGAIGLWKRGGAVRDVELLAESADPAFAGETGRM